MNALIIGGGHLGTFLNERLSPAHHYTGVMDHLTQEMLDAMKVDVVVNTAGKTSLEFCESNPLLAFESNVAQPLRVMRKIREQLYIHISSGCVWDGPYDKHGHPFGPFDQVSPACFYAWTKASCDALMLAECGLRKVAILRPRQVYSPLPSPRNTLTKLRTYKNLIDTPNSMTSAETIAKTIEFLAEERKTLPYPIEMNVFDLGVTTPYRVGILMHEMGLRDEPEMMTKSDLDLQLKPRRVDAVLQDDFFVYEVDPPKIEEEMPLVVSEYAKRVGK